MNAELATVFAFVFGCVSVLWVFSTIQHDVSLIDRIWGLMFLLQAGLILRHDASSVSYVVAILVAIWAMRLSVYLHLRNRGQGEDYRYVEMRKANKHFWITSLLRVFFLQAALNLIIAAPLWFALKRTNDWTAIDFVALGCWLVGFYMEAAADLQLSDFKSDQNNRGRVLDRGMWSMTRHPNYFGDCLVWWSFFLFALNEPNGWQSFFGPLLLTFLIIRVSGVALLEKSLHTKKPEYRDYIERVPAFIPNPLLFKRYIYRVKNSRLDQP